MGLNETLDRLKWERAARETRGILQESETEDKSAKAFIADLAERVFFQRMLKDINPGMSEPKIDAMIDRSVMIATKLFNKFYR